MMSFQVPKFDDQMLDHIQIIHDLDGPRAAYAFYLGRRAYPYQTADLDTNEVEDFAIGFYTQYNQRFGQRY
jgi:hypothetical protein